MKARHRRTKHKSTNGAGISAWASASPTDRWSVYAEPRGGYLLSTFLPRKNRRLIPTHHRSTRGIEQSSGYFSLGVGKSPTDQWSVSAEPQPTNSRYRAMVPGI